MDDSKNSPTLSGVRSVIGSTWFDVLDEDGRILLESRDYGDVGEETAGQTDVKEGRRILHALRDRFPLDDFQSSLDVCDEWVTVELRKEPRSADEKARRKQTALVARTVYQIREAIEAIPTNDKHEKALLSECFSWDDRINVVMHFGERFLYRTHLGAVPRFKSPDDARDAGLEFLNGLAGLPIGEWEIKVTGPFERLSYNFSPPAVIERVGKVYFKASIDPDQKAE